MFHKAHLRARPKQAKAPVLLGLQPLNVGSARDSYLYVPCQYRPGYACPLIVLLHGAGGHARHGLELMQHLANHFNLVLLAPASNSHTWDVIAEGEYDLEPVMNYIAPALRVKKRGC